MEENKDEDSIAKLEKSEESPSDWATLRETLVKITTLSSTFIGCTSSLIKGKQVIESSKSSPFQEQPSLNTNLDDQFVDASIEPLPYPSLLFSCPIYYPFLSVPEELSTAGTSVPNFDFFRSSFDSNINCCQSKKESNKIPSYLLSVLSEDFYIESFNLEILFSLSHVDLSSNFYRVGNSYSIPVF